MTIGNHLLKNEQNQSNTFREITCTKFFGKSNETVRKQGLPLEQKNLNYFRHY